jgi:hypothetical protein
MSKESRRKHSLPVMSKSKEGTLGFQMSGRVVSSHLQAYAAAGAVLADALMAHLPVDVTASRSEVPRTSDDSSVAMTGAYWRSGLDSRKSDTHSTEFLVTLSPPSTMDMKTCTLVRRVSGFSDSVQLSQSQYP